MAATPQFPWELLSQIKDQPTMVRLESACDTGLYYGTKLAHHISEANLDDESFSPSDKTFLTKCVKDNESLVAKSEAKQILVGVSGATGAGKSSLLNALLDFEGLLPSSDSSASTATICEVAYNFEEDLDKAFRCDVHFRNLAEMREELDRFFGDLKDRKSLLEQIDNNGGRGREDDKDWEEAVEEADGTIQDARDKIFAIWGKTLEELEEMSTDDLLRQDDPAMDFIRAQKQTVYAQDKDDFADKIIRFLDSTRSEIQVARPEGSSQTMSLWPLIRNVKLFVKADILRSGVVLVDLPGLSDVVGARAHLAEEYYGKLNITMVVTPVVRGADEMTGVSLMSKNQALNMKMDGKFDHKSFCVVLSKADVLNWPRCHPPSLALCTKIEAANNRMRAEMDKAEKRTGALEKRHGKAKSREEKESLNAKIEEWRSLLRKLRTKKKHQTRSSKEQLGAACFKYRQARDKPLMEKIEKLLKRQHDDIKARSRDLASAEFKVPRIFSVGTKAYWDLEYGEYVEGFPSPRYTGIPALRQWLQNVSIPNREKATMTLIKEHQSFYNSLQTWSDDLCLVHNVKFSTEEFEEQILGPMLVELKNELGAKLKDFEEVIKDCNPLKGSEAVVKRCQTELVSKVKMWARRYPDEKYKLQRLNHMTYGAIIKRGGGPFISHAGGRKTRYDWMEDLASLFNSEIVIKWTSQLHQRIPMEVERFLVSIIDELWKKWHGRLVEQIAQRTPGLDKKYLGRQAAKLSVVKERFKNSVSATVSKFVAEGPSSRTNLQEEITAFWQPGFAAADRVLAGRGVTARKEEALVSFCVQHGVNAFEVPVQASRKKIDAGLERLGRGFDHGLSKLMDSLRLQTQLIGRKITDRADKVLATKKDLESGEEIKSPKERLVKQIRAGCEQWSTSWGGQDFDTIGEDIDNSVPVEWSVEKEPTSSEDSESESEEDEVESEEDEARVKTEKEDVDMER